MSEYLRYIKQEWRDEIPVRIRGWWHRHWWPSHIKMLKRERDDWKRWLYECESKFEDLVDPADVPGGEIHVPADGLVIGCEIKNATIYMHPDAAENVRGNVLWACTGGSDDS